MIPPLRLPISKTKKLPGTKLQQKLQTKKNSSTLVNSMKHIRSNIYVAELSLRSHFSSRRTRQP